LWPRASTSLPRTMTPPTAMWTATRPVTVQFYGDRSGSLKDPVGHTWHISTHKEDVS
jgi:uncharacterized glyoxalase superfamily protein PhnB